MLWVQLEVESLGASFQASHYYILIEGPENEGWMQRNVMNSIIMMCMPNLSCTITLGPLGI